MMKEEEIKRIVENFPDNMFFDGLNREEQIEEYVSAIQCKWQSLESENNWMKIEL